MHDLRVRGEQRGLAGDPVVEPGAQHDQQVGLLQRQHGGNGAVHARHAEVLLVRVGERAAGHERRDHGCVREFGEREQFV